MNLKGRIERLENHHSRKDDTVTLGDIVRASYWKEGDPRDLELEERISRSRLGRMLSESLDRGRRSDALAGGPGGPTGEVNQERGVAHV